MLPFDQAGSGPAVVLLHAGIADRSMWRETLEWLSADGFTAIAPELPGLGEAASVPAPWQEVLETLRDIGVGPATVVGNSFGAAVALRMAVVAPDSVTGLMLISPPPVNLEPSLALRAAWEAEEQALARSDIDAAVDAVVTAWTQPGAPSALRERVAAMQRRTFELQAGAEEPSEAPDPLESDPGALERVRVPALLAAGEYDMPDFQHGAREQADALPLGRAVRIPGAGHLAPLETPDEFRDLLRGFLRGADVGGG